MSYSTNYMRTMESHLQQLGKQAKWIILTLVIVILLFASVGTIGAGERGVKTRFGAVTGQILGEGLYFKLPFIEQVVTMNVQINNSQTSATSASRDLQSINTTIGLNYHLNPQSVDVLYQEFRKDYEVRFIAPVVQEAVKSATAQFTAEELITKRTEVREVMRNNFKEKLEPKGILVDEVNIVNFSFSESFDQAIERKVTAEQEALAAENKLEQVKFEAQQKIEEAKGKAEAIRIEAIALKQSPAVLELRALEKWDGVLPQVTSGAVPFITIK